MKVGLSLIFLIIGSLSLAAQCGPAPANQSGAPEITVTEAYAPTAMAGGNGVIYLKLENKGGSADTLLKVESQAADAAEIHETSIGENDVMRMGFLSKVEVPPGETISLEPGGKHIMLVKLKQALELGHKIKLTLTFEKSGPLTIEAGIHQSRVSAGHSLNHGEDK